MKQLHSSNFNSNHFATNKSSNLANILPLNNIAKIIKFPIFLHYFSNSRISTKTLPLFLTIAIHLALLLCFALPKNYLPTLNLSASQGVFNYGQIKVNLASLSFNSSNKINSDSFKSSKENTFNKNNLTNSNKLNHSAQTNQNSKNLNRSENLLSNNASNDQSQNNNSNLSSSPIFNANYLNNPAPEYPDFARRNNIEGKVLLLVSVGENGKVQKIEVNNSSGNSLLDKAALGAVKNWSFIPANKDGRAISAQVIVPIEFKIA